jgi:hypothetical protein
MDETPEPSDAADALAVALCHLQGEQFASRFGLSGDPRSSRSLKTVAPVASRSRSAARISSPQPTR